MEDIIKSNHFVSNCTVIAEGRQISSVLVELNFKNVKDACLDVVPEKGK